MKVRVMWDTGGENVQELPDEVDVPDEVEPENVSDWLSHKYDWLVDGWRVLSKARFWKTTYEVEVLSYGETPPVADLKDVLQECEFGGFSGDVKSEESVSVSYHEMRLLLEEQRSDPDFLSRSEDKCEKCGTPLSQESIDGGRCLGSDAEGRFCGTMVCAEVSDG